MQDQFLKNGGGDKTGYLITANDALLSDDGNDTVLTELLAAVVAQNGSSRGWVAIFEPRSQQFVIRSSVGLPNDDLAQFVQLRSAQPGPGPALALRKPVIIENIETSKAYAIYLSMASRAGVRSVISTPFFTATDAPLGILCMCFPHVRSFSEADIRLAQLGAQQMAIYARTCHALADGRQRLARLTQDLPVITWSADAQGRVVSRQMAWEAFSGMEFEHYRDYRWQTAVHPEDWKRIEDQCLDALATGTSFQVESRLRRADGVYRSMRMHANAWKMADGTIREWTGYCEDRTDLLEMKEQLAMATSRTTRVLSILAHDLRNPLSTLSLAAKVIQNPGMLPARFEHFGRIIERQTRKMAQMVNDLLDVTRIARGRLVLDQKPVAMRSVVEAATESAHLFVKERRHSLSVNFPKDTLRVFGDRARLVQAVGGLVSHAAKTMVVSGHISVTLSDEAQDVALHVEQSRGGIDPAALLSSFDLAGANSAQGELEGQDLNLSLALIKSIVTYHGGNLSAFSNAVRDGITYRVTLPKMDENV